MRSMTPGFHAVLSSGYARLGNTAPHPKRNTKALRDALEELNLSREAWDMADSPTDRSFWAAAIGRAQSRVRKAKEV